MEYRGGVSPALFVDYEKAIELLKKVHIDHLKDNYPSQVSGGEKQRCAIARAW